jgi:putative modified peptide
VANSGLTEAQALALLNKLAQDDAFRGLFENDPKTALTEIGVSAEALSGLSEKCLESRKLESKAEFQTALDALDQSVILDCMAMHTPNLRLGR